MRWQDLRRSSNVEYRGGGGGGRGLGIPLSGGGLVLVLLASLFFGFDPSILLDGGPAPGSTVEQRAPATPAEQEMREFVAAVLGDTEETWHAVFRAQGRAYEEPRLIVFSGAVQSACGIGQSATGPFYCPPDRQVYLDLSFFRDLQQRFGAPGDFAQAYVIAHEVGHHVQTILGIAPRVRAAQERASRAEANNLSVRMELQADCFAGLWAHHAERARQILETGDVEEALAAASAIGDDRLQRQTQGRVTPDSFTHGSSEQRVRWFRRGLSDGTMQACDTFAADRL
jgi:uncharacterized protein